MTGEVRGGLLAWRAEAVLGRSPERFQDPKNYPQASPSTLFPSLPLGLPGSQSRRTCHIVLAHPCPVRHKGASRFPQEAAMPVHTCLDESAGPLCLDHMFTAYGRLSFH